jgi:hypothetical protein
MSTKNLATKFLLESIKSLIVNKSNGIKIVGTREEIGALAEALVASKNLDEEINGANPTVRSIAEKSEKKRTAAANFQRIFGLEWPV